MPGTDRVHTPVATAPPHFATASSRHAQDTTHFRGQRLGRKRFLQGLESGLEFDLVATIEDAVPSD